MHGLLATEWVMDRGRRGLVRREKWTMGGLGAGSREPGKVPSCAPDFYAFRQIYLRPVIFWWPRLKLKPNVLYPFVSYLLHGSLVVSRRLPDSISIHLHTKKNLEENGKLWQPSQKLISCCPWDSWHLTHELLASGGCPRTKSMAESCQPHLSRRRAFRRVLDCLVAYRGVVKFPPCNLQHIQPKKKGIPYSHSKGAGATRAIAISNFNQKTAGWRIIRCPQVQMQLHSE